MDGHWMSNLKMEEWMDGHWVSDFFCLFFGAFGKQNKIVI
jgi:hypothetical protein